jgi:hypothetical protein
MSNWPARSRIWIAILKVAGIAYLLAFLGYFADFCYFDSNRPTKPDAASGRVIPQYNHGHVVFLTDREQSQLLTLQDTAIGLFLIATVATYFAKKNGAKFA